LQVVGPETGRFPPTQSGGFFPSLPTAHCPLNTEYTILVRTLEPILP
jgi:hypothetical protein